MQTKKLKLVCGSGAMGRKSTQVLFSQQVGFGNAENGDGSGFSTALKADGQGVIAFSPHPYRGYAFGSPSNTGSAAFTWSTAFQELVWNYHPTVLTVQARFYATSFLPDLKWACGVMPAMVLNSTPGYQLSTFNEVVNTGHVKVFNADYMGNNPVHNVTLQCFPAFTTPYTTLGWDYHNDFNESHIVFALSGPKSTDGTGISWGVQFNVHCGFEVVSYIVPSLNTRFILRPSFSIADYLKMRAKLEGKIYVAAFDVPFEYPSLEQWGSFPISYDGIYDIFDNTYEQNTDLGHQVGKMKRYHGKAMCIVTANDSQQNNTEQNQPFGPPVKWREIDSSEKDKEIHDIDEDGVATAPSHSENVKKLSVTNQKIKSTDQVVPQDSGDGSDSDDSQASFEHIPEASPPQRMEFDLSHLKNVIPEVDRLLEDFYSNARKEIAETMARKAQASIIKKRSE